MGDSADLIKKLENADPGKVHRAVIEVYEAGTREEVNSDRRYYSHLVLGEVAKKACDEEI